MLTLTYFVHGTTIDNEKGIATGWNPGELSKAGIKQARELGRQVALQHFDAVFCSDLKRAQDSAQLGFGSQYQIIPDARLRECNYGDFNGKLEEFKRDMVPFINTPFPHGESYQDVEKRMADFLKFLKQNYNGQNVAIVAHQAPQLALEVLINKKTWEEAIDSDWRRTKTWQPGWKYEPSAV